MIIYYIFMGLAFALICTSVFPEFNYMNGWHWLEKTCYVTFGLSFLLNVLMAVSDPGCLEKDPSIDFVQLVADFECNSLCPICKVIKTPRTKHCPLCNKCIDRMDHHCPWVNNCVGRGNIKRFYAFIIVQFLYLVAALSACIVYLTMQFSGEKHLPEGTEA